MTTPQTPVDALTDEDILLKARAVGGLFDDLAVNYQSDDLIKFGRSIEASARALAAIPAPTDPEDCNAWCPRCNGSGDDVEMSDSSPDAHEVLVNCRHCDGSGTLYGAYTGVVRELEKRKKAYLKACGDLYFAKNAPTPPTAPAQDAQGVTVDSIRAAGGIVHSDGNIFFTNIDKLRAALRASSPAEPSSKENGNA